MSDEIMRILKLLEDGKINAEEAERLIGAMDEKKPRGFYVPVPPKMSKEFLDKMENIPEQIGRAVSTAFGAVGPSEGKRTFRGAKNIQLKVVSGDIEIVPSEGDIAIDGSAWPMKTAVDGDLLVANLVNADMIAQIPDGAQAKISVVSADLRAERINGEMQIEAVSGDIELRQCKGSWSIRSVSGDVDLQEMVGRIEVATKSGDIDVDISEGSSYVLETTNGNIEVTIPEGSKVIINAASEKGEVSIPENIEGDVEPEKADITISALSESGDITISTK